MTSKSIFAAATAAVAMLALPGCAVTGNRTADSAITGAAAGAAVGAVTPGISTAEGAIGGAAAGAIYGAATDNKHSDKYCAKRYDRRSADYRRCRNGN